MSASSGVGVSQEQKGGNLIFLDLVVIMVFEDFKFIRCCYIRSRKISFIIFSLWKSKLDVAVIYVTLDSYSCSKRLVSLMQFCWDLHGVLGSYKYGQQFGALAFVNCSSESVGLLLFYLKVMDVGHSGWYSLEKYQVAWTVNPYLELDLGHIT